MKIEFLSGHNFPVDVGDVTLSLSYKGFGGKDAAISMGEEGVSAAISALQQSLSREDYNPQHIHSFFQRFSCGNAIVLIEAICPLEFAAYWSSLAKSLKCYGLGYSFSKTLAMASGTKDRLNHHQDNPYVQKLTKICTETASECCFDDATKTLLKRFDVFRDVSAEGIEVTFKGAEGNTSIYDVNGSEVVYCKRIRGDVSTSDVLNLCLEIRDAVQTHADLKSLTEVWGGSLVFRVMGAVCAADAFTYFQSIADAAIARREKVTGLKVLKNLNYDMKDAHNQDFINKILSILEESKNKQSPDLVDGNADEIRKNDKWQLYYAEGKEARYCSIDFTQISNDELRQELLFFMRSLFEVGGHNYTNSVMQISRYANSLIPCMVFFETIGVTTLWDLTKAHIEALILEYRQANRSVNYIAESLLFLRKMHRFLTFENSYRTDMVFGEIDIPQRKYGMEHVTPASDRTMQAIEASRSELQSCIELADLVLKALESRSNDTFALPADCVIHTPDGTCFIEYTASKNGRVCRKTIPEWLAQKIETYATETTALREELGMNLLFVYSGPWRSGSSRQPQVLSADKFNYHISKLLREKGVEDIKGEHATQTARQIRAAAGKKRFASGQTPLQVAKALGNSPGMAYEHYRELDYREYATLRRDYNSNDMKHLAQLKRPRVMQETVPNHTDYGRCTKPTVCSASNICSQCPSRMIKRGVQNER